MSNVLNEMMGSTNEYAALQEEAKKLSRKWSKTGLLEGLGDTEKGNMALMLETQAKQLIKETTSNVTGTGGTWSSGTGEQWAGIALPLIRRIFANISSKDFVSVQPMKLPSGLVFFLDFRYATDKAPFNVNDSVYGGSGGKAANAAFLASSKRQGSILILITLIPNPSNEDINLTSAIVATYPLVSNVETLSK